MGIRDRMRAGEVIRSDDPGFGEVLEGYERMIRITAELNTGYRDEAEVRRLLSRLTLSEVPDDVKVVPPFHTDWGQFIRFGREVFINSGCHLLDQGGITLGDGAMLGPAVKLITTNHLLDPNDRRAMVSEPISIGKNAWIGAGAIVLPGITVGEDAVVGAGSVVTRDVPAGKVVAGNPARVIGDVRSSRERITGPDPDSV